LAKEKNILYSGIEYLKGVGPKRAELLKAELGIRYFKDLLYFFPFRYTDRTHFVKIKDILADGISVQLKGILIEKEIIGGKNKRNRLGARLKDDTGYIDLIWFQGVKWLKSSLKEGQEYIVYGKVSMSYGKKTIVHPEIELLNEDAIKRNVVLSPVYSSTEKLTKNGLSSRAITKLTYNLLYVLQNEIIKDSLPEYLLSELKLISAKKALFYIHFPKNSNELKLAENRLKFEELFFLQLRLLFSKISRKKRLIGHKFSSLGKYFNGFYEQKLPFELTGAQKKVIKEIRIDLKRGIHMNRLLQGDVGSGKTIVALMVVLMALDNDFQACFMAPTEILAQQHFFSIEKMVSGLGINIAFLSGSVKGKKRASILNSLSEGSIDILIGTHALIEDWVIFKNLGIVIIDEQHRFGVKQRAKLWRKGNKYPPHVLVMTATPIPRTLSMTLYGDLDISIIDELPPGRKEIKTLHFYDSKRPKLIKFIEKEIGKGRQIYVVYPLIEESEKLDLKNLEEGYENLLHYFPRPKYQMSIVHGRMKPADKELEMQRFKKGKTQILVGTTVIEVGVDVANASVMVIENAERFGLSQLHQLRGRVGRGAEQSYCILMSSFKLSKDAKERLSTMVRTNNGFEIAEVDMRLRGPGDIEGVRQSGLLDLKLANIVQDENILRAARSKCINILKEDPKLELEKNKRLKDYILKNKHLFLSWGRIS